MITLCDMMHDENMRLCDCVTGPQDLWTYLLVSSLPNIQGYSTGIIL